MIPHFLGTSLSQSSSTQCSRPLVGEYLGPWHLEPVVSTCWWWPESWSTRGASPWIKSGKASGPVAFLASDGQKAAAGQRPPRCLTYAVYTPGSSTHSGLGQGMMDSVAAESSAELSRKWPLFSFSKRALRKGPQVAFLRDPGHGRSCGRLQGLCVSLQVHGWDSGLRWLSRPFFEVLSHVLPMIPHPTPAATARVLTLQTQTASETS